MMKLSKDFIELQGFRYETEVSDGCHAFTIRRDEAFYELLWDQGEKTVSLTKYSEDEDDEDVDECFYEGEMPNVLQFCRLLIHVKEVTQDSITLPNNFVDLFMEDDYDEYTLQEFDDMCDICLMMLLAKEEYEKCRDFLDFRRGFYNKKGWEYKDMPSDGFKDYSSITTNMC
jgi:hypothetical protein